MLEDKVTKQFIEMRGSVEELLPGAKFKIRLENDQVVTGYLAGKMRKFRIRLLPGDDVKIELSPYDLTKGRVVYRF
jgi:translation initiation factor IF-1